VGHSGGVAQRLRHGAQSGARLGGGDRGNPARDERPGAGRGPGP
jgi:hypothetical protein